MKKAKIPEPPKIKRPVGRPSTYKIEYCELLIDHCEKGLSFEAFAGLVGVTIDTIHGWAKKNEEFSEAKKVGAARCRRFWEELGVKIASGKMPNANAAVYIFNMKNRFQWRDKTPDEIKEDRRPIVILRPSTGQREVLTDTMTIEAEAKEIAP